MNICSNIARDDRYIGECSSAGGCSYGGWGRGDAAGEAIGMTTGRGTVNCHGDIRNGRIQRLDEVLTGRVENGAGDAYSTGSGNGAIPGRSIINVKIVGCLKRMCLCR